MRNYYFLYFIIKMRNIRMGC